MPRIRIIAGDMRGRFIDVPDSASTRPTTNRVREAVMSSVFSLQGSFEGTSVLDAFAGSGAMGFEALSRGASHVLFCDEDSKVCSTLERNAASLKIPNNDYQISKRNVLSLGFPRSRDPYDIVFLDPPYRVNGQDVFDLISRGKASNIFSDNCLFVYEHDEAMQGMLAEVVDLDEYTLEVVSDRTYGKTIVTYLRFARSE